MEFERADPYCKFTVPDAITVRQQLAFYSSIPARGDEAMHERVWEAGRKLIEQWECPIFPDKDADLDSVCDAQIPLVLIWAGSLIRGHLARMKDLPKNS